MKSIIMPGHVQLDKESSTQLTTEVKETLAADTNEKNSSRKFTADDMWNRQRQYRSASFMIRRWNMN